MTTTSIKRMWSTMRNMATTLVEVRGQATRTSSPVPHLLCANEPPTDEERDVVKETVKQAKDEILQLDQQLKETPHNKAILRRLSALNDLVVVHEAVLAPWRRLPVEILIEIFSCFILAPPTEASIAPYVFVPPWPGICRQVCKRWHTAIHATPELFSYLPKIDLNKKTENRRYLLMLNQRLSWSEGAPLRVSIYAPFIEYESHPALEAVMAHAQRWDLLHAAVTFSTLGSLRKVKKRLKSLRFLTLDIWRYDVMGNEATFDVFAHATSVEGLTINGLFPDGMIIPWGNLKAYRENVIDHGGLATIFTHSPLLENIDINENFGFNLDKPVTMPHLTRLRFNSCDNDQLELCMKHLVLPALEDATILGRSSEMIPILQALVTRSSCSNLQRLAFVSPSLPPGQLAQLLRLTPNLVELNTLAMPDWDLARLEARDFIPVLVPSLKRLRLYLSDERGLFQEGGLTLYNDLVRSRCGLSVATGRNGGLPAEALDELRLVFLDCPWIIGDVQSRLEGWDDIEVLQSANVQTAINLRQRLACLWPGLGDQHTYGDTSLWKKKRLNMNFDQRLNAVLSDVEQINNMDAQTLHSSKIHFVIRQILAQGLLASDKKYGFEARVMKIHQHWQSILAGCAHSMHWAKTGRYSLIYIPDGSERRHEADFVEKVVFGLDETLHHADLLWLKQSSEMLQYLS
ncbi:hypothetical protein BKA70DRAFT_1287829, partial [Coprinopsis sp. MPI-PUGE-AT-0042]